MSTRRALTLTVLGNQGIGPFPDPIRTLSNGFTEGYLGNIGLGPLGGADLLSLLVEKGGTCGLEDLRAASEAAHGKAAVYCNCHGDSFDFDGVIAVLGSKGKIQVADGRVSLGMAPACQH